MTFDGTNLTVGGNVTANSDLTLKQDILVIDNALDKVSALRGVYFTRKDNGSKGIGVVAQEVVPILPEVIHKDSNGLLSVAYGNIVGVLIEAIKDLKFELDDLKKKLPQ
jgi:hypothetical protein